MNQSKNSLKLCQTRCNSAITATLPFFKSEIKQLSTESPQICEQSTTKNKKLSIKGKQVCEAQQDQYCEPIHSINTAIANGQVAQKFGYKSKKYFSNPKQFVKCEFRSDQKGTQQKLKMNFVSNRQDYLRKTEIKKKIAFQTKQQLRESIGKDRGSKQIKTTNRSNKTTYEIFEKENNQNYDICDIKGSFNEKSKIQVIQSILSKNKNNFNNLCFSLKNSKVEQFDNANHKIQEENSLEYIDNETPGPGSYSINESSAFKKYSNKSFGTSQRFQKIRPITANAGISGFLNSEKQKYDQMNENVAFGTNKQNLRSEVKKIQYCDWNRPHFYQCQEKKKRKQKEHACFQSAKNRFTAPKQKYCGPDYYSKQSNQVSENDLPSHYFLSQVPKGITYPIKDQSKEMSFSSCKNGKVQRKTHYANFRQKKTAIANYTEKQIKQRRNEDDFSNSIQKQIPKNSLGTKNRRINISKQHWSMKIDKQQSGQLKEEVDDMLILKQAESKIRKRKQQNNQWIKPSFNVYFQVNSPSIRA